MATHKQQKPETIKVLNIAPEDATPEKMQDCFFRNPDMTQIVVSTLNDKRLPQGLTKTYEKNKDGTPFCSMKAHYDQTGQKNGLCTHFYPDGQKKYYGHMRHDMRQGLWQMYRPTGLLVHTIEMKDDRAHGIDLCYGEDGRQNYEAPYVDNKVAGGIGKKWLDNNKGSIPNMIFFIDNAADTVFRIQYTEGIHMIARKSFKDKTEHNLFMNTEEESISAMHNIMREFLNQQPDVVKNMAHLDKQDPFDFTRRTAYRVESNGVVYT